MELNTGNSTLSRFHLPQSEVLSRTLESRCWEDDPDTYRLFGSAALQQAARACSARYHLSPEWLMMGMTTITASLWGCDHAVCIEGSENGTPRDGRVRIL